MKPPQILLVDDEPNVLRSLQRLFFDEEYELSSADSGEMALEILQSKEVDLIVADCRMPGMSGIEFFQRVRNLQSDAIRIILSGFADINVLTDAINQGHIYKFIFKPWNDQDFKNTVRLALKQKALQMENRRLAEELKGKNLQLERFNRELECRIEDRTRDLQFRNRVLQIAQEILERLPLGVIGTTEEGIIVLMNRQACALFDSGLGRKIEEVLPPEVASECRNFLIHGGDSAELYVDITAAPWRVTLDRLNPEEEIHGAMMVFQPVSDNVLEVSQTGA